METQFSALQHLDWHRHPSPALCLGTPHSPRLQWVRPSPSCTHTPHTYIREPCVCDYTLVTSKLLLRSCTVHTIGYQPVHLVRHQVLLSHYDDAGVTYGGFGFTYRASHWHRYLGMSFARTESSRTTIIFTWGTLPWTWKQQPKK